MSNVLVFCHLLGAVKDYEKQVRLPHITGPPTTTSTYCHSIIVCRARIYEPPRPKVNSVLVPPFHPSNTMSANKFRVNKSSTGIPGMRPFPKEKTVQIETMNAPDLRDLYRRNEDLLRTL